MSETILTANLQVREGVLIDGEITTENWAGGNGDPYCVLRIGPITIFTQSGIDPVRDFLGRLRDEVDKVEQGLSTAKEGNGE